MFLDWWRSCGCVSGRGGCRMLDGRLGWAGESWVVGSGVGRPWSGLRLGGEGGGRGGCPSRLLYGRSISIGSGRAAVRRQQSLRSWWW